MAKIAIYTGLIRLAGDTLNVAHRTMSNPITAPEVGILQMAHGADAVSDLEKIGVIDRTAAEEKARLNYKYDAELVEMVYPGRSPQMEFEIGQEAGVDATDDPNDPNDPRMSEILSQAKAADTGAVKQVTPAAKTAEDKELEDLIAAEEAQNATKTTTKK